jgi:YbbR domain-containing protein
VTDRAGRWGLRILAFVGAVVIWWITSVETRERISEKVVDASLSYNSPRGLILLDPIQTVKVRLRGPDRRVRAIAPFDLDVVVDVQSNEPGMAPIQLRAENVLAPEEVEIVSIDPNVLEVRLDREAVIEVPILVRLVGEPAGGSIPGEPVARPGRARIRGPATIVSGITSVSTSPISLDGHALDFSQTVSVVSGDPLVRIVEPTFVTVDIPMSVPEPAAEDEPRATRRGRDG